MIFICFSFYKLIDVDPEGFLELLSQAAHQDDDTSGATADPVVTTDNASAQPNNNTNNDNANQATDTVTVALSPREHGIINRVCIYFTSIDKSTFVKRSNLALGTWPMMMNRSPLSENYDDLN